MAEISGFNNELHPKRRATLVHSVEDLFGGAGDQSKATFWSGLRPATPTNIPFIGQTPRRGIWVNAGHGTLGWTHAAGSGKALAALMHGDKPDLDFRFYGARA
jgi:D-amino-acid dehydrogenase